VVFVAGMEEGLFPHSRSLDSEAQMEEERRLCYVGMTRAEKRLYLSWARSRRRYGGGQAEQTLRSRFLREVPATLLHDVRGDSPAAGRHVDLFSERHEVRETARKNLYTGKTYNSVENIRQFFTERGAVPQPAAPAKAAAAPATATSAPRPAAPPVVKKKIGPGSTVQHATYGRGTVVRLEGSGEDTKLTVNFPGYGIKKLVAKYAGIKIE
jgi:DNA helicase-2/ATP-dependent DNA helicase PcrA